MRMVPLSLPDSVTSGCADIDVIRPADDVLSCMSPTTVLKAPFRYSSAPSHQWQCLQAPSLGPEAR